MAGCSADTGGKATPVVRPDADARRRWAALRSEQTLLALHAATIATHPDLAAVIQPLSAHHDEHLAVLQADGPLPVAAGAVAAPVAPAVPADPAAALSAVRDAEQAASAARLVDCVAAVSAPLAALLASIAAAEAGHAGQVTSPAGQAGGAGAA